MILITGDARLQLDPCSSRGTCMRIISARNNGSDCKSIQILAFPMCKQNKA